ncbi:MAG: MotA/TolQ/ExbB proton channel family protein, partial [Verrucomicrobiota bacterium]
MILITFLLSPELMAQAAGDADAAPKDKTLWDLIQEGGWAMIPLGICSMVLVALVIYNFLQLSKAKFVPADLMATMMEHMGACRVRSAIEVASASPSFLGRMMASALPKVDATDTDTLGREAVEDSMTEFTMRENRSYSTMISYLSVIAQGAPMLGLLGTVSGMIGAFGTLESLKKADPSKLAGDISEALVTTATGLVIALPALIFYFVLKNR